jgi:hypothetical protein
MYKLRDVNRSIQFNPIDEVLEELHIYTGELGIKKRRRGFGVVNINPLGNFTRLTYINSIKDSKRNSSMVGQHGSLLPKEIPVSAFITFPVDHANSFIIYFIPAV